MKRFLDSNVFLYAFLNQDAKKKIIAVKALTRSLWEGSGYISVQVAKEFCNVMTKKSTKTVAEIIKASEIFDKFNFIQDSIEMTRRALEIKERYQIQFYDSMMLAAAERAGCDEIYTEDLSDGQEYCGIKAINPFNH